MGLARLQSHDRCCTQHQLEHCSCDNPGENTGNTAAVLVTEKDPLTEQALEPVQTLLHC